MNHVPLILAAVLAAAVVALMVAFACIEGGIAARLRAGLPPDGCGCLPQDPGGKYRDAREAAGIAIVTAAAYRAWDLHKAGDGETWEAGS